MFTLSGTGIQSMMKVSFQVASEKWLQIIARALARSPIGIASPQNEALGETHIPLKNNTECLVSQNIP